MTVRLYLKPELGRYTLVRLSAAPVQAFLNKHLAAWRSGHIAVKAELVSALGVIEGLAIFAP